MSNRPHNNIRLPVFGSLMCMALILGLLNISLWQARFTQIDKEVELSSTPEVLGYRSPWESAIRVAGEGGWGYGGIINIAETDKPVVYISSDVSAPAQLDIYQATSEMMLAYLLYDSEGKQLYPTVDTQTLPKVGSTQIVLEKRYTEKEVLLPIEGAGIWLLKISRDNTTTYSFVIRAPLAVVAKEGNNEFVFWGQDLTSKRSITTGRVRLFSLQEKVEDLGTTVFNDEGIATFPLSAKADVAVIERGEERGLLPLNLHYLNTGWSWKQFEPKKRAARYFVFTDRPLYQPGDTVYFKALVREDDDARYAIGGGQVRVEIYTGWGDERNHVLDRYYTLSEYGSIDGVVELPDDVGSYTVSVSVPGNEASDWMSPIQSYTNFEVQHYRKPDFYLEVNTKQHEYINQDTVRIGVKGQYFYGQPITNKEVEYSVSSAHYYDHDYWTDRDTMFTNDYRYGYWYGDMLDQGTVTLDQQGEAVISVPTHLKEHQTRVLVVTVRLTDEAGTSSEAIQHVLVYAAEFGIYRASYDWDFRINEAVSLPIIAVNHFGGTASPVLAEATLIRKWWEKLPLQEGEKYHRYEERQETLPNLRTTTDSEGKGAFDFIPTKTGYYELIATAKDNKNNLVERKITIWVHDSQEVFATGPEGSDITIRTDKARYEPGETARLTVTSSIPNRDVLLTMERGRMDRHRVIRLEGSAATVDWPIYDQDMPNTFALATSFSSTWIDTARAEIPVSTKGKHMRVEIQPEKETYGPGETVRASITTTTLAGKPVSAELALWAVDKAIFELAPRQSLDIFNAFWNTRYHGTSLSHSLESIVVQAAEMGGGCFTAGTPITMADGTIKLIEEIKTGDRVLTQDVDKNVRTKAVVERVYERRTNGYYIINGQIQVTGSHPFWTDEGWRQADILMIGDVLRDDQDRPVVIEQLTWQREPVTVYNLEVAQTHTFYAHSVLVHNKDGGPVRDNFVDTAYWNPRVITSAEGKAFISFTLPDNLTTWTIAAVGGSRDSVFGDSKKDIVVGQDVIVRPVVPNLLRVGDVSTLAAMVHNYTSQELTFDVSLDFDGEVVPEATKSGVVIGSNARKNIAWTISPTILNENATIRFSAKAKEDKEAGDTIINTVPVIPFGFYEQWGGAGMGNKTYEITLAPDADIKQTVVTLSLASTMLGTLPTAMNYLVGYPYGCVEQTTSRFVPVVIAAANPSLFPEAFSRIDRDKAVADGVSRLKSLQNNDGGWGWWSEGNSDPFITAYVAEYLVKAKQVGLLIDDQLVDKTIAFFNQETFYIKGMNDRQIFQREALVAKTYALSWLEPDKKLPQLTGLDEMEADIIALAVMANYRNGESDPGKNGLDLLIAKANRQGEGLYWNAGVKSRFGSNEASTALVLRAVLMADTKRETAAEAARWLMRSRKNTYWMNTFATAQAIQAMTDMAKTGNEMEPNYSYQVLINGQQIAKGRVSNTKQTIKDIVLSEEDLDQTPLVLEIIHEGTGQLYSTLLVNEFHTDKAAPAVEQGLRLSKDYIGPKGANYTPVVGDEVTVRLTLNGLGATESYGVIVDELPAGMIPINPVLRNESRYQVSTDTFWRNGVSGFDITQNGIVLSLATVYAGQNVYQYKARVIAEGEYGIPPATAHLMYAPEIHARTEAEILTIGSTPQYRSRKASNNVEPGIQVDPTNAGTSWIVWLVLLLSMAGAAGAGVYFGWSKKLKSWWVNKRKQTEAPALPSTTPPQSPKPDNDQ
jgi:alpha-2-macroglobulin